MQTKQIDKTAKRAERVARSRRDVALTLPEEDFRFLREEVFEYAELVKLQIDESYQRVEHKAQVNNLIAVLVSGGNFHEPIIVAERDDGSLWIVDGQQRWWAAWCCEAPLRARIHRPSGIMAEKMMFLIAQKRKVVAAAHMVKAWPNGAGATVRWLNGSKKSPLYQRIAYSSSAKLPASTVVKCLMAALRGVAGRGSMDETLAQFDRMYADDKARVTKMGEMLGVLLVQVFDDHKIYNLYSLALSLACYERWCNLSVTEAWPTPNAPALKKLKQFNWAEFTDPSGTPSIWLPILRDALLKIWKVAK